MDEIWCVFVLMDSFRQNATKGLLLVGIGLGWDF
jgi:hypothetical protein